MERTDVYTAAHKSQRRRLFDLTVAAGCADVDDAASRARLARAVHALADELVAHAHHEDRFIHPTLRRHAPALADALEDAHGELDSRLDQLRDAATRHRCDATDDPNRLYRALASFTSTYLAHLEVEEGQALPALWRACRDDELGAILTAFRASRSDAENLTSTLAQLPALNPREVARMTRAALGEVPLADVVDLLSTLLDPGRLGTLLGPTTSASP